MSSDLFDLKAETAVVVGGTGVLGGGMADALAGAGAKVAVLGRNEERGLERVRAIDAAGIEPRMIELEFTEGALIEYSAVVSKAVKALKELGVATALDDFGTGYSSLSYLRHFPIDTLKIDRVFVRDIVSKSGINTPLVDAIIAMAKSLGLATVAEGVETEAQWHYLKSRQANQVQGFLFCRPLPIVELERWHADWLHSHQQSSVA